MILKVTTKVRCPHCGRNLVINLDLAEPDGSWLEDCQVCKKSISFSSLRQNGTVEVTAEQTK